MSTWAQQIPDGFRGTERTIQLMRALARDGGRDERVRRLAGELTRDLPRRDYESEARRLLQHMQRSVRYVRDPWTPDGTERVQHPAVTLFELGSGDCDCLSTAYCALCGALGAPYAFRTIGTDPWNRNHFSHVYSLVFVGPYSTGRWVPADPSFGEALGWEPPLDTERASPLAATPGRAAVRRDWAA